MGTNKPIAAQKITNEIASVSPLSLWNPKEQHLGRHPSHDYPFPTNGTVKNAVSAGEPNVPHLPCF